MDIDPEAPQQEGRIPLLRGGVGGALRPNLEDRIQAAEKGRQEPPYYRGAGRPGPVRDAVMEALQRGIKVEEQIRAAQTAEMILREYPWVGTLIDALKTLNILR